MKLSLLAIKLQKVSLQIGLIVFTLLCTIAYAETPGQPSPRPLEAWEQAQDYSLAHPVIAFAIYGRIQDATAQEIGQKITNVFASYNIESKYFLAKEERMGSSLGFYLQGVSFGPVGFDKVLPVIRQVITHFREEFPSES